MPDLETLDNILTWGMPVFSDRVRVGQPLDPKDLAVSFQKQQLVRDRVRGVLRGQSVSHIENAAEEIYRASLVANRYRVRLGGLSHVLTGAGLAKADYILSGASRRSLARLGAQYVVVRFEPQYTPVSVVEHYEARIQNTDRAIEKEERTKGIVTAWENRELLATLMDNNWLGLTLLSNVRTCSKVTAEGLATRVGVSINSISPTLAKLVRFGAVDVENEFFVCTPRGIHVLESLEQAADVRIDP